jgi:hypothetical protein
MLVLGLILILLSAGTLVAVLSSGTDDHAQLYGGAIDVSTLVVFLAGAAALLVFIMGLELVRSGVRRANANRKTKKKLRRFEKREEQRVDTPADPGSTAGTTAPTDTTAGPTGTTGTTQGGPYETPPPPPPSR